MKYQGRTKDEWIVLTNSHTVDSQIESLVKRAVGKDARYFFKGKPSFATLEMENKPTLAVMEALLAAWKTEELARIEIVFADAEKANAIRQRLEALKHPRAAASEAAKHPNGDLILHQVIENRDEVLLAKIEEKDALFENQKLEKINSENAVKENKLALKAHLKALKELGVLTDEQKILKDILKALT